MIPARVTVAERFSSRVAVRARKSWTACVTASRFADTGVEHRVDQVISCITSDKAILKNKAGTTVDTCKWGDGPGALNC